MKRILSLLLCMAMLIGMFATVVSAANYAIGSNTTMYNAGSIIATGGNCMYVTANTENGYAVVVQNDSSTEMGTKTFTLSHAYCIMGATGSDTSRIAIGTSEGMVLGYDYTNKCFFISKNGELFGTALDASKYTYRSDYRLVAGCWYYIAFRFTATTAHIYLNGTEVLGAKYSDMGLTRSGWAIYYPKNINFYADNYQFFMDDTRVSYSANLGSYISGTKAVVYAYGTDGARAASSLGDQEVNLGQVSCDTLAVNGVQLTATSVNEIQIARKAANEANNSTLQTTANNYYATFLNLVRDAVSAAYNPGKSVTKSQINTANNAWAITPADGKSVLAGEGYMHLLGKANAYYHGMNSSTASDVRTKINAIGTVAYTDASKSKIDAARKAYDAYLTYSYNTGYNNDVTEGWIDNALVECMATEYNTLTAAEAKYAELKAAADTNQTAANAVISKINAIGTVAYNSTSKSKIDAARSAYNALTDAQKKLVTNLSTLTAAEAKYTELKTAADNKAAADAVIDKINAIGTVAYTDGCKTKIDAARSAYNALTSAQQALVTNYSTLTTAESAYNKLVSDTNDVIALIKNIGAVVYTDVSKTKIDNARAAYNALDGNQQGKVTNYSTLTAAESAYDTLKTNHDKADAVIAKISAIGTVVYTDPCGNKITDARNAYKALTADQQALVTNYSTLTAAETKYANLKSATDAVVSKIKNLGTITYQSGDAIQAAEAAYAALDENQKVKVTNYATLTSARSTYNALHAEVVAYKDAVAALPATPSATDECRTAIAKCATAYATLTSPGQQDAVETEKAKYDAFRAEWEKIVADTEAADAVTDLIDAIGTITYTADCKAKIDAAKEAFSALTADQQKLVPAAKRTTINNAPSVYNNLEREVVAFKDAVAALPETPAATDACEEAIAVADSAYALLTDDGQISAVGGDKAYLEHYKVLVGLAVADKDAADAVASKINAIGTVSYTQLSKNMIDSARAAYEALTDDQKALVSNYQTLLDAEAEYAALKKDADDQAAADAVVVMIFDIGEVTLDDEDAIVAAREAYEALTPDQQAKVANFIGMLETAENELEALKVAKAEADPVIALIDAIGTVTLDSEDEIKAAEDAYAALSDAAKALVDNYDVLTAARSEYKALVAENNELIVNDFIIRANAEAKDSAIANKADIEALIAEYETVKSIPLTKPTLINSRSSAYKSLTNALSSIEFREAEVRDVIDLIDAIGEVTLDSGDDIEAAFDAYANLLTDEQRDLVTNYQDLLDAEYAYDTLLAEKNAKDAASAVNKVGATSLVISDSLAINYKVNVGNDYEIVGVEFTLAGVTTTVTDYIVDANGRYVFRYDNIAPNLMGETIYSVIVVKDADGKEIKCYAQEYSIVTYANRFIADSTYTGVLASMIYYGDASVAYTDDTYTAPSTLINNWDVYSASVAPVREYTSIREVSSDVVAPAVTWGKANLILSDSVSIRIQITGDIADDYKIVAVYNDVSYDYDLVCEDGVYSFVWDRFNMAQMSNACDITFTVCDADGNAVSNTLTYSVESYVADMLGRDAELDSLLTALMQYGDAALAYRNNIA